MNLSIKEKYRLLLEDAKQDLKTPGKRHKQIPNILTAARLFAPICIIPAALTGNFLLTACLAAGFGLTDLVDGLIARKFNLQSELGAKLDAVTDKVFVGTLLMASSFLNPFLLINFGLELAIAGININAETSGRKTATSTVGKIKTWGLFILASLGIIAPAITITGLLPVIASTTAILQCLTIHSYINKYNKDNNKGIESIVKEKKTDQKIEEESTSGVGLNKTLQSSHTTQQEKKEETLKELKEISGMLHAEQENKSNSSKEKKVYQKIK